MSKSYDFLFRLNGSLQIGLGHVFRCRELAFQLKKNGKSCVFIVNRDKTVANLLEDFELIQLPLNYSFEEENLLINKALREFNIETIISDLLDYPEHYKRFLKDTDSKTVSFHEKQIEDAFSNKIINYNSFQGALTQSFDLSNSCLGPKFCILPNDLLQQSPIIVKSQVKKILLSFGGSDPANYSTYFLKLLDDFGGPYKDNTEIIVHLGPSNGQLTQIKSLAEESDLNLTIQANVNNLIDLMLESDLAVCSGGNTMYELCFLGVPCMVLPQNKHQQIFSSELEKNNILKTISLDKIKSKDFIFENLIEMLDNSELRKNLSKNSTQVFDGCGLNRVVDSILSL